MFRLRLGHLLSAPKRILLKPSQVFFVLQTACFLKTLSEAISPSPQLAQCPAFMCNVSSETSPLWCLCFEITLGPVQVFQLAFLLSLCSVARLGDITRQICACIGERDEARQWRSALISGWSFRALVNAIKTLLVIF